MIGRTTVKPKQSQGRYSAATSNKNTNTPPPPVSSIVERLCGNHGDRSGSRVRQLVVPQQRRKARETAVFMVTFFYHTEFCVRDVGARGRSYFCPKIRRCCCRCRYLPLSVFREHVHHHVENIAYLLLPTSSIHKKLLQLYCTNTVVQCWCSHRLVTFRKPSSWPIS